MHPFCCLIHLNSLITVSMWRGDNEGWFMLLQLFSSLFYFKKRNGSYGWS